MAIIGKIRNRAGLIIGTIGVSMVAFIAGDLITNNRSFLFGNKNEIAVVAGQSITPQEFNSRVELMVNNYKLNQNKDNVDPQVNDQLREQAWNEIVKEIVYGKENEQLGVKVSDDELYD
ncbi:MAG: SurA N-terminal domain-containing protein, partial [Bacteroidota bacterium]